MSTVADRTDLTPDQQELLEHFLSLRHAKQQRVMELCNLHNECTDEAERQEILSVIAECLFRHPESVSAIPIGRENSPEGALALDKHRTFVGGQIKKRRQELKMSQAALAEKAGLPQSHISRLETGKHAPTYLTIEKVAAALGVKPSQLDLGFDD